MLTKVLTAICLLGVGCSDGPWEPYPPAWTPVTPIPYAEIHAIAVKDSDPERGVYAVGNKEYRGGGGIEPKQWFYKSYIKRYDGYEFTEVYAIEHTRRIWLNDVDFAGRKGWAVGGKERPNGGPPYLPLMVYFDGDAWKEIPVHNKSLGSLQKVYAINENECWLIGDKTSEVGGGDTLIKYSYGNFTIYGPYPYFREAAYARGVDLFYAGEVFGEDHEIFMTADRGATWHWEKVRFDTLGYKLERVDVSCAVGADLYLIAKFVGDCWGLVRRTGVPGAGVYELIFLSNKSANFYNIKSVAFEETGRGLAVGLEASVFYDGQDWRLEKLPYRIAFKEVEAAGGGGFWAFGENIGVMSRWELLYHP